jgi:hypothetical protein
MSSHDNEWKISQEMLEKLKADIARGEQAKAHRKKPKSKVTIANKGVHFAPMLSNMIHDLLKPYESEGWTGQSWYDYDIAMMQDVHRIELTCHACGEKVGQLIRLDENLSEDAVAAAAAIHAEGMADAVSKHRVGCKPMRERHYKEFIKGEFHEFNADGKEKPKPIPQVKKVAVEEAKERETDECYPDWDY